MALFRSILYSLSHENWYKKGRALHSPPTRTLRQGDNLLIYLRRHRPNFQGLVSGEMGGVPAAAEGHLELGAGDDPARDQSSGVAFVGELDGLVG